MMYVFCMLNWHANLFLFCIACLSAIIWFAIMCFLQVGILELGKAVDAKVGLNTKSINSSGLLKGFADD